ncbi:methyltransferase domain-containing protein [Yunchengibacter salinarum]|uniref:methyltransferase domain-containing protein n=1 Tax=Yunchengibacter salinarum TaxID=3133399 RepID=UPI0035B6338E
MPDKSKAGKEKTGQLPLRLRLKAWWEGYDQEDLAKRWQEFQPDAPEPEPDKKAAKSQDTEQARPAPVPDDSVPMDPWDAEKINIAQYIWGEGYCGPGGPEHVVAMSKLMALSPEMSMLQIGAEIGGPARVLADRFGVWITGYEESPSMVDKGNQMSVMKGVEKKAHLEHWEPDNFDGFERKFDRALAKEAFFTIENKRMVLEQIEEKLKPGGLILITDYVIGSEATYGKTEFKEWKVGERRNPYPVLADDLVEMLKHVRLQVRVSEDISDTYVDMINKAWAGADEVAARLAKEEGGDRMIQMLMREAEFWTRRKKMLESGDLKLWRIVANKKAGGPSMMSDW